MRRLSAVGLFLQMCINGVQCSFMKMIHHSTKEGDSYHSSKTSSDTPSMCWKICDTFSWKRVVNSTFCKVVKAKHHGKGNPHSGIVDNRQRCYDAYHTMVEHRDWSRTWEGPPEPSSSLPWIKHTMMQLNAPHCDSGCELDFYTPAMIRNMLCNIHAKLGEKPQLVFQGSSVTRGQILDFIRYLRGGAQEHDILLGTASRHGPWVFESPHCIIYYFFTGGLYSEKDPAARRVPLTHDVGSTERLLELSMGTERVTIHVHKHNESNHETGSSAESYAFKLNKPNATILIEFGPSIWDNCYLPSDRRDDIMVNHSIKLISIMNQYRNNLAPGAKVVFRTMPKISAGSKRCYGKGTKVNEAILATAHENEVDVMRFDRIVGKNRHGSVDGIHWNCVPGTPRNTKYNTTNGTDGSSLHCHQMPERSEVSLASAFYIGEAIYEVGGHQSIGWTCPLPNPVPTIGDYGSVVTAEV